MNKQQPTYDQEQAIRDYTHLMEAGPLAENEEELRALIKQAYAHNMYFDYDCDKRSYVLRFTKVDFPNEDFRAMATAFSTVTGVLGGFCITILVLVISKGFLTDQPIEVKNWIIGLLLIGAFVYLASAGILANSMNAIKFKDTFLRQIFFNNGIFLFHLGNLFLVAAVYVLISNVLSNEVLWGLNAVLIFIVIVVLIIALVNFIMVVIAWGKYAIHLARQNIH